MSEQHPQQAVAPLLCLGFLRFCKSYKQSDTFLTYSSRIQTVSGLMYLLQNVVLNYRYLTKQSKKDSRDNGLHLLPNAAQPRKETTFNIIAAPYVSLFLC